MDPTNEILDVRLRDGADLLARAYVKKRLMESDVRCGPAGLGGTDRALDVFLYDSQQRVMGGLLAGTFWGCVEISVLWVEPAVRGRGHGAALLATAEREATARGCQVAIVRTFSFQAPGFYRRHGYEEFGRCEGKREGHSLYYFRKQLR